MRERLLIILADARRQGIEPGEFLVNVRGYYEQNTATPIGNSFEGIPIHNDDWLGPGDVAVRTADRSVMYIMRDSMFGDG